MALAAAQVENATFGAKPGSVQEVSGDTLIAQADEPGVENPLGILLVPLVMVLLLARAVSRCTGLIAHFRTRVLLSRDLSTPHVSSACIEPAERWTF